MTLEFSCPKCKESITVPGLNVGDVGKCKNCGSEFVVPYSACLSLPESVTTVPDEDRTNEYPPVLTVLFYVFGVLEIVGGILLCVHLWPPERIGYEWKTLAYSQALTWLVIGFVSGSLFLAVGEVLSYLRDIRNSLHVKRPNSN